MIKNCKIAPPSLKRACVVARGDSRSVRSVVASEGGDPVYFLFFFFPKRERINIIAHPLLSLRDISGTVSARRANLMGGYPDLNRELTVPHTVALPIELYPPICIYLINTD
jgi:hypothetical protein